LLTLRAGDYEKGLALKLPAFLGVVRQEISRGRKAQPGAGATDIEMAATLTSGPDKLVITPGVSPSTAT
jgi:hypothetical protein